MRTLIGEAIPPRLLYKVISTLKKKVDDIPATITKFVNMTEAAYEALETKDPDTYYMLTEE